MPPTSSIAGLNLNLRLVDHGRPVAGATVALQRRLPDLGPTVSWVRRGRAIEGPWTAVKTDLSDADGRLSIAYDESGQGKEIRILVLLPDGGQASLGPFTLDGDPGERVMDLAAVRGRLVGSVREFDAATHHRREVLLWSREGYVRETRLDRQGQFRFDDLPPGRYRVALSDDGQDGEADVVDREYDVVTGAVTTIILE